MSCSACCVKFNLIRREKTCDSCQLSHCSKCLIIDEKSKERICRNCLKAKTAGPSTFSGHNTHVVQRHYPHGGLKDINSSVKTIDDVGVSLDEDLKNRLQKLQDGKLPAAQNTGGLGNIEERLAKLKGGEVDINADHKHDWLMKPKPKKTQIEETEELLNEVQDETKISSNITSPEEEIARRLAKLKGEVFVPDVKSSTMNDIDYDPDVNAYLKAYEQGISDPGSGNLAEVYSEFSNKSKRAEMQNIDREIRTLMSQRRKTAKKSEDSELNNQVTDDDESGDESEIEQVIKQVLMTKDDEDELDDDTKYEDDTVDRNNVKK